MHLTLSQLSLCRVANGENGLPLGRALFGLETTRTLGILTAIDLIQTDHLSGKGFWQNTVDLSDDLTSWMQMHTTGYWSFTWRCYSIANCAISTLMMPFKSLSLSLLSVFNTLTHSLQQQKITEAYEDLNEIAKKVIGAVELNDSRIGNQRSRETYDNNTIINDEWMMNRDISSDRWKSRRTRGVGSALDDIDGLWQPSLQDHRHRWRSLLSFSSKYSLVWIWLLLSVLFLDFLLMNLQPSNHSRSFNKM